MRVQREKTQKKKLFRLAFQCSKHNRKGFLLLEKWAFWFGVGNAQSQEEETAEVWARGLWVPT